MEALNELWRAILSLHRTVLSQEGLTVGRMFLGGMFALSGALKLRHPFRSAMAMVDFGVIKIARTGFGTALGVIEVALAGALLMGRSAEVGLVLSTALLTIFTLLILRNLLVGRRTPCFCFGSSADAMSGFTLIRTAAFAGLSLILTTSAANVKTPSVFHIISASAIGGVCYLLAQVRFLTSANSPTGSSDSGLLSAR